MSRVPTFLSSWLPIVEPVGPAASCSCYHSREPSLLLCILCHDVLYLQTISQHKPFLPYCVLFLKMMVVVDRCFVIVMGKVTNPVTFFRNRAERCSILLSIETDYETKREGTRNVEGAQEEKG